MSNNDPAEVALQVIAALDFVQSTPDDSRAHFIWTLKNMMATMPPETLSTPTLASLVAILIPEHCRVLAATGQPGRGPDPVLRLVSRNNGVAG